MPFNISKCHILQVDTRKQKVDYKVKGVQLESVQCFKYFRDATASSLKFSLQCQDAVGKRKRMLGFINRNFSKNIYIIVFFYIWLVRPRLEKVFDV